MPRVPIPEREVATAPLPGARLNAQTSARTFGASLGSAVADIAERAIDKADQIAVLEADRRLVETETALLHDPKTGALNRRGRDAFAVPEEALGAFDAQTAAIEQGLRGDRQRLAFRRSATARRLDLDRALQRHVAGEIKAYDSAQTEAYLSNELNAGIAAAGDAERIALAGERLRAAVVDHAARNGLPPEWVQQKTGETQTKLHGGVIERLLAAQQDRAAAAYYDAHKDSITGTERARLEKALEVGSTRGESQRQADAILAQHPDRAAALAAAKGIAEPTVRDAVETRLRQAFADREQARAERERTLFRNAATAVERTGDTTQVAPSVWAELEPAHRAALETRARQVREGVEPVTNYQRYYDLMNLASADETRHKFVQVDLMQYRGELSNRHFEELARLQGSLRTGTKADEALDGYRTKKQIVDDSMRTIGLDPTVTDKTSKKKAEQVNLFRRRVDEEILALQAQTGKKATGQDVQTIVDNLLIKGTVPGSGWIWDDSKRLYELKPGEAIDIPPDEIPPAERAKIEEALKRRNVAVTPANIAAAFRLKLQRQKPAGGGAIGAP